MFNPISVYLYKIDESLRNQQKKTAIKKALLQFANRPHNQFIVFSSSIEDVVELAASLNMFHVFNQWLFFLPVTTDRVNTYSLTQNLNEGANIAFAVNDTVVGCQVSMVSGLI